MQLININYAIGSMDLFKNLSFRFQIGNIIGLIGMNGSGKSTLLKVVSGSCEPQQGQVQFENRNLYEDKNLQREIAYVPSMPFLYPFLTVYENLAWVAKLRNVSITNVKSLIQEFELTTYTHFLYSKLSEGFKKRVGLACAFLHQPRLLILDEPCAGLDSMQRQFIWDKLKSYRDPSRLILFSSHHPDELTTFSDEIYLLSQGKLLQYFPSPGLSHHLWQTISTTTLQPEEEIME